MGTSIHIDETWPEDTETRSALERPWAIGDAAWWAIRERLSQFGPGSLETLVEFGSGASTAALAQAFPQTHILSIDHDPRFAAATKERLPRDTKVELALRPLVWQDHGGAPYLCYEVGELPERVDAVLIDGPPHWTRGGREAALYQVWERLRVGGLVFLDDYRRPMERKVVSHWLTVFAGSLELAEVLEVGHHVAVLRKTDHLSPRWDLGPRRARATRAAWLQPFTSTVRRVVLGLRGKLV